MAICFTHNGFAMLCLGVRAIILCFAQISGLFPLVSVKKIYIFHFSI
jgi:hypothetical protein